MVSENLAPDVPPDWAQAIQHIFRRTSGRVVVLGPLDVGKSSFCHAFLGEAARRQRAAGLVDADVGQKTVGPPAAVTLAYAERPDELAGLAFVGTTDPVRGLPRVVAGMRRLLTEASADLVVVNTGGLLAGAGRRLKAAKLAGVLPDLIVTLGNSSETDAILEQYAACPTIRLTASPEARKKTRSYRRRLRAEAFRRYFEGASVWHLHAGAMTTSNPSALPKRLLVGIVDDSSHDLAMGILLGLQRAQDRLDLYGPDLTGKAAIVVPGMLCLDKNFRALPAIGS